MGVRISGSKTFRTQVEYTVLTEAGKKEPHSFEAVFKRMGPAEVKDLVDNSPNDSELVKKVLIDWSMKELDTKEEIPYSEQMLDEYLRQVAGVAGVIALRFLETVGASRSKN